MGHFETFVKLFQNQKRRFIPLRYVSAIENKILRHETYGTFYETSLK